MRRVALVLPVLAASLVGCASMQNTPRQDYVWEMGRICDSKIFEYKMIRVEADGRYWIQGIVNSTGGAKEPYFACMNEQMRARPYLDWIKARQDSTQSAPSAQAVAAPATTNNPVVTTEPIPAPVWRVGDEWEYAYKSPSDSGTYVWSVIRLDVADGVQHYVVKSGTREIFYRVSDLAVSMERVDGTVVIRHTPPRQMYSWPLTPGKVWDQDSREERPVDRQNINRASMWTVEMEETVTVPAGTFRTVKIIWRNRNTSALLHEMWYAPEAKQWVKMREILSNGAREREMVSFKLR